ncbi:MAG: helix-turn-helix transcriptional regulator [Sinobacterium sp.]|nr:helix-turn-helix transcriptional regulator [Sinobacterium sp.]
MGLTESPAAVAAEIGERLKQARLNSDMTQAEVAATAGISRKLVGGAEKGKAQLETLIAIMQALELSGQLELFLPPQEVSPIQLLKLQGDKRQRASGQRTEKKGKAEW